MAGITLARIDKKLSAQWQNLGQLLSSLNDMSVQVEMQANYR